MTLNLKKILKFAEFYGIIPTEETIMENKYLDKTSVDLHEYIEPRLVCFKKADNFEHQLEIATKLKEHSPYAFMLLDNVRVYKNQLVKLFESCHENYDLLCATIEYLNYKVMEDLSFLDIIHKNLNLDRPLEFIHPSSVEFEVSDDQPFIYEEKNYPVHDKNYRDFCMHIFKYEAELLEKPLNFSDNPASTGSQPGDEDK